MNKPRQKSDRRVLFELALLFFKLGVTAFGGPAAHIAMMEEEVVVRRKWMTRDRFLVPGALISTTAIFLPSFFFVLILNSFIPRLRSSKIMSAFLDAVNISAIGLMAAVVVHLAGASLTDWRAVLIAAASAITGLRFRLNPAWLVLGGSIAGWILKMIPG